MPVKKRPATKRKRSNKEAADDNTTTTTTTRSAKGQGQPKKQSSSLPSSVIYGSLVLVVGIAVGLILNLTSPVDSSVKAFLSKACRTASCGAFVVPIRRTLQAIKPLRKGDKLMEIPRRMQIWDLDALQDPFVRLLFAARHERTENKLPSGAFLAAWLAMQKVNTTVTDPLLKSYLELLPSEKDVTSHPVFWESNDLNDLLGGHSYTMNIARMYQDMVHSEYFALDKANQDFGTQITLAAYKTARIHVLSRSFSPGPPGPEEGLTAQDLELYKANVGTNFSTGCHAMVPILDLLNHHPKPNVAYKYDSSKRSFVITASKGIRANFELMDSYGKFTDPHLFAKFGFVNGDGSGHTQASMALFHRLLDWDFQEFSYLASTGMTSVISSFQRKDLRRYLQYDDGYPECIQGPETHPAEFELKKLKLDHLVQIANDPSRWTITLVPPDTRSTPAQSSEEPITLLAPHLEPSKIKWDISKLVATCRLMALITSDFDGKATEVLTEQLGNSSFAVERGTDALEYRALMCVARLTSTTLAQYKRKLKEEQELVETLNEKSFQSRNWTAAHLRFGEMQTLHTLAGVSFAHVKKWDETFENKAAPELTIRPTSCLAEYLDVLSYPEPLPVIE